MIAFLDIASLSVLYFKRGRKGRFNVRRALADQAVREFNDFNTPKGNKFTQEYELYNQRFQRWDFGDEDKAGTFLKKGEHEGGKMSVLKYPLFFLPIHYHSHEEYYQRHAEYIEKEKKWVELTSITAFDDSSEEIKRGWLNLWSWPSWKFNDIIGFVDIGLDCGNSFTANIYLKRKYLPKDHPNKNTGLRKRTGEILFFREVSRAAIRGRNNTAYLEAIAKILLKAEKIIKKTNDHFKLWEFPFELENIDLVQAVKQAIKKKYGKKSKGISL